MGSSEMEDDSLCQHSGHSSKLSLHDKKTSHENDLELDLGVSATPLSHSAARHKMAVKPKRTHGAPRRRRIQQLAGPSPLPSTPELNEESSGRSASPDVRSSNQDFTASDELNTVTATTDFTADQATAWPSDDGMKSVANPLPAETQLKSASLPPGLALTPEMSNAESPITPALTKVKRCNSSIAQRQSELATAAMQHLQRSISEQEYNYSTRTTIQHQSRTIISAETDSSKGLLKGDSQRKIIQEVGEEEDMKEDDSGDDILLKEKDREDKKKDDSSFFSRLIRRSGKKKKEISQDIDSLSNNSSYSNKTVVSDAPSVVPKRIDLKGRYANETVTDYPVNLPPTHYPPIKPHTGKVGGTRSTPASRQRVMPINIPASPEGQRKAETNREMEEVTVGLPLPTSPSTAAPEPETIGKTVQEPVPVNRMQISYSTSPPKPTWPESSVHNRTSDLPFYALNKINSSSEIIPSWREGPETKLVDNAGWPADREHGITEVQHFRSKLRIAGLSSYQQRVTQISSDLRGDEREYTSLIDTMSSEESAEVAAARQNAVKKSKSFRREVDIPHLSHNLPLFTGETETDTSSRQEFAARKYENEQLKTPMFDNTSSQHMSYSENAPDRKDGEKIETSDFHGRLFTKNSITARSVLKESSNIAENSPVARICNSRHPDRMMKKSASLDSIGSFGETKKSPSPDNYVSYKKSSSSESINSYTQQVTVPVYAEAISITHNTRKEEEETASDMEEKRTLPFTEVSPLTTAQPSQLSNKDKVTLSEVPKPIPPTALPIKPSIPESSKPPIDITAKPSEPNSRPTSLPVDKNVGKIPSEKGEQSQNSTSQRVQTSRIRSLGSSSSVEHVPEFLKVQLNRVDSKPATTSMVFDGTERNCSPLKSIDNKQIGLKRKESLGKLLEKNETMENTPKDAEVITTASVQIPIIRERKSSKEDLLSGGNVVFDSQTEANPIKIIESGVIHDVNVDNDTTSKITENNVVVETISSPQKQRSKSLTANPVNISARKFSVVSISSNVNASTPPSKPVLKKQAMSLDAVDNRKNIMKKQMSQDIEDNSIAEKLHTEEGPATAITADVTGLRKKANTKECTSWKDDDSTISSDKSSEGGTVEVVLRSKKIISTRDFGIKREEEQQQVLAEKRISGVKSVISQEGKKLGLRKEDENQSEKRVSGGENSNSQETNSSAPSEVVLRKKSLSREISRGSGKDEEPELLKVFARRSLKLKDSECEALGQQVSAKAKIDSTSDQQGTKSRDSDKENEGGDSPREERKKQMIKEPLAESKIHIESSEPPPILKSSSGGISHANTPRNGNIVTGSNKYQRSLSSGVTLNNENGTQNNESSLIYRKENPVTSPDKRQRNRTVPESPKTDSGIEKTPHRAWANNIFKEKEIDITNNDTKRSNVEKIASQGDTNGDDNNIPRFKRIQQRKEEWELRAQQAKKTLP
ncbi:hypothetical protein C0J52_18908 [Blattella germanica]|nr:hypothetical protein C0J52_18908 [Blattella germanica]